MSESYPRPPNHSMAEVVETNNKAVFKPKITVFHCFNAISSTAGADSNEYDISAVRMPCSSMTREVFLLRAFEAGADAVVVMVCPEGDCRYMEGNIRAGKRVARVKKILDEIGLDGKRLNIYPVPEKDLNTIDRIIKQTVSDLAGLGPNPAS
ncbi:MAG: hydrogenase iron-sulfur subunit [Firmicutes bacterium HGW-Firmicutes-8]|nr:MAG: hydrogenase iron-sulfur subunit [Firmicutes bacterium HGW-Firmicutes-8]